MADAQFKVISNTEMKLYMEALLINGLVLVSPPARVWHPTPQFADFREHIVDQLIQRKRLTINLVSETLLWNRNNGLVLAGGWDLKATKIQATAHFNVAAGALDYDISCDPFSNWESDLHPSKTGYDSELSDESTRQNFSSFMTSMKPLNILAWNVRGAGSSDFRRAFMDLLAKHKPNVVLLTETRVGGDRATSIINSLGFTHHCKVDPMGYAGGLWLLWNGADINMHIHGQTF